MIKQRTEQHSTKTQTNHSRWMAIRSKLQSIVVRFHDSPSLCDKYMIYRQGPNEHWSLLIFVLGLKQKSMPRTHIINALALPLQCIPYHFISFHFNPHFRFHFHDIWVSYLFDIVVDVDAGGWIKSENLCVRSSSIWRLINNQVIYY